MKAVVFTDIHFGLKNNSDDYNAMCNSFIDFMIDKTKDIDTCLFLGDWHHYRSNISVNTLCASIQGLAKLSKAYKNVYMLLGNHDLYYKNRLDVHSMEFANLFPNIQIIDKPTFINNDMLLLPWLLEGDRVSNYKAKFIFCHAEIPSFYFNKKIKMDGLFDPKDYQYAKRIYSGHLHCRQLKNNIQYIGNCFSHDFSDVDDYHNKGFMVLDTEAEDDKLNTFYEWEDAPKYTIVKASELKTIHLPSNANIKIINDENKSSREMLKLKTEIQEKYDVKNCSIIQTEIDVSNIEPVEVNKLFQNLETTIVEMLKEVHYDNIDNELLQQIFRELNVS